MADQWEEAAKQFKANAPTASPAAKSDDEGWKIWTPHPDVAPTSGNGGALDYAKETLSNVPSSAGKFVGNLATAVRHPIDTAANLGKVVTGTLQNMTPGYVTPERPGYSAEANAAGQALKDRYGSGQAILNTIKTDPVGALADASAVAGGVSGVARGAGMAAEAANLPRVASAAGDVSRVAGMASDIANPLTLPMRGVGATLKGAGRGLVRSALSGIGGKTERYGATPAVATLEETRGIRPATIRASAAEKLDSLNQQLENLAKASGNQADLSSARQVITDEIAKVKAANGLADDLTPMQDQLTKARSGFAGATTPTGDIDALQSPMDFLGMKRQFGQDYTKFDAAVPLKDQTRRVGNQAYHALASEFNNAVPGGAEINQRMQSLIPVRDAAQRTSERAGPIQRSIDRATRPTGALVAPLAGGAVGGPVGAATVMALQEALASPAVRMAGARGAYGAGKLIGSPIAARAANAAAVAGSTALDPNIVDQWRKRLLVPGQIQ